MTVIKLDFKEWIELQENQGFDDSRRKFLKQAVAGGIGAVVPSSMTQGSNKILQRAKEYEAEEDEETDLGQDASSAAKTGLIILPRNEEEEKLYDAFINFIHSKQYRNQVMEQLTMTGPRNKERFDEKGWELLQNYMGNKKVPKIDKAKSSVFSPWTKTVGIGDEKSWTPSMILRHELDHAFQGGVLRSSGRNKEQRSSVTEVVSLFDGPWLVLIDQAVRKDMGLDPYRNEKGETLYSKPIKFPSGAEYTPLHLANLTRRFFPVANRGPSNQGFQRSSVELLGTPEAMSFLEKLIYGDNNRGSYQMMKKWRSENKRFESPAYQKKMLKYYNDKEKNSMIQHLKEKPQDFVGLRGNPKQDKKLLNTQPNIFVKNYSNYLEKYYNQKLQKMLNDPEKWSQYHKDFVRQNQAHDDPTYQYSPSKIKTKSPERRLLQKVRQAGSNRADLDMDFYR